MDCSKELREHDHPLKWLLCEAGTSEQISEALKGNPEIMDVVLTLNGVEIDPRVAAKSLEKQWDRATEEAGAKLVQERIGKLHDLVSEFEEFLLDKFKFKPEPY